MRTEANDFEVDLQAVDAELTAVHHKHRLVRAGSYTVGCAFTYPDGKPCDLGYVAVEGWSNSWAFRVIPNHKFHEKALLQTQHQKGELKPGLGPYGGPPLQLRLEERDA